ncbi:unnamed protein product [Spirodela intermedia]|uniref:Uncharacterized protein n=1 Tax=Spirodela intermedia TaxID=51605 RepID=A0A7I8JBT5_SPIIN|nr:unnamed protein product [Spirodela intermedia]CAA6667559.1 unnamed protein product [Spirodela intermedia]
MAKKRNNKKKGDASPWTSPRRPRPAYPNVTMDASEAKAVAPSLRAASRKISKGIPIRRAKNLRKQKAIERAISNDEKQTDKIAKNKDKLSRIQSAKSLYD